MKAKVRVARVLALLVVLAAFGVVPTAGAADEDLSGYEPSGNLWLVELSGSSDSFRAAAKAAGVKYSERASFSELWNGVSIAADASQVNVIRKLDGVRAVYPNLTMSLPPSQPDLNFAGALTGADIVKNTLGFDGSGVKVAVMDTGIDYNHPDLGGCFGPGCRVAAGFDFVGDAFNADSTSPAFNPVPRPDPDPDDCNGHGTHVSGIIGANGRIKGVAPGVTFGAYRVFGCEGSTTSDIMIAAMERALRDKMDVLNMSIGAANVNFPDYPTAKAASRLAERGVVVVASIGNSGPVNLYSAGAPGVGEKVIGVAAMDNTKAEMYGLSVSGTLHPWGTSSGGLAQPPLTGSGELRRTGTQTSAADACPIPPATVATLPSLAGKIALIRRGTCGFYNKALAAQRAGAVAVVLYNNVAGRVSPSVAPVAPDTELVKIPVVFISQASGNAIDTRIAGSAIPVTLTWTDQFTTENVPTAGTISSFSSWGLASDLTTKPDLAAPGGNILSTYPLEKNGYANISGTSMSSPHVAGASALLLEAKGKTDPLLVRTILQNSADPRLRFGFTIPDAVHRQGAGMLDIDDAILATTLVTPGKLSLGEGNGGTRTLTIANNGTAAKTYSLSPLAAFATGPGTFAANPYVESPSTVSFGSSSVTVPAGGSADVDVTITPNATLADKSIYSGWIVIGASDGSQYSVPYTGFKGDYQSIKILSGVFTLARLTATGGLVVAPAGSVFKLNAATELPLIAVHFDHQVQELEVEVTNAATGARLHPVFSDGLEGEFLPRNGTATGLFAFSWDGTRLHSNGSKEKTKVVPDGSYRLTLKVLKPLGDPADPAHRETATTVPFTIDRP